MKRWGRMLVVALAACSGVMAPAAGAEPFDEGVDYQRVAPAQPTEAEPGKVEVLELFWYGCPHCYHLEPLLEQWLAGQPDTVAFRRMPAVLGDQWAIHARAFYAAEVLGVSDKVHQALFDAMHAEKRRLNDEASLAAFFAEQGVDEEQFRQAFHSFSVETKLRRAMTMTRRYGIDGVPAFVVNGKFRTSASLTGTRERMFEVLEALVKSESGT